jgi:hypothetical protein
MDKHQFRAALEVLRLNCDEFADLAGWSRATVYEWGTRAPVPHPARCIIALLAERAGVNLDVQVRLPPTQRRPRQPVAVSNAERFLI